MYFIVVKQFFILFRRSYYQWDRELVVCCASWRKKRTFCSQHVKFHHRSSQISQVSWITDQM